MSVLRFHRPSAYAGFPVASINRPAMENVTRWLNASGDWSDEEVFQDLYDELKKIARSRMQGGP